MNSKDVLPQLAQNNLPVLANKDQLILYEQILRDKELSVQYGPILIQQWTNDLVENFGHELILHILLDAVAIHFHDVNFCSLVREQIEKIDPFMVTNFICHRCLDLLERDSFRGVLIFDFYVNNSTVGFTAESKLTQQLYQHFFDMFRTKQLTSDQRNILKQLLEQAQDPTILLQLSDNTPYQEKLIDSLFHDFGDDNVNVIAMSTVLHFGCSQMFTHIEFYFSIFQKEYPKSSIVLYSIFENLLHANISFSPYYDQITSVLPYHMQLTDNDMLVIESNQISVQDRDNCRVFLTNIFFYDPSLKKSFIEQALNHVQSTNWKQREAGAMVLGICMRQATECDTIVEKITPLMDDDQSLVRLSAFECLAHVRQLTSIAQVVSLGMSLLHDPRLYIYDATIEAFILLNGTNMRNLEPFLNNLYKELQRIIITADNSVLYNIFMLVDDTYHPKSAKKQVMDMVLNRAAELYFQEQGGTELLHNILDSVETIDTIGEQLFIYSMQHVHDVIEMIRITGTIFEKSHVEYSVLCEYNVLEYLKNNDVGVDVAISMMISLIKGPSSIQIVIDQLDDWVTLINSDPMQSRNHAWYELIVRVEEAVLEPYMDQIVECFNGGEEGYCKLVMAALAYLPSMLEENKDDLEPLIDIENVYDMSYKDAVIFAKTFSRALQNINAVSGAFESHYDKYVAFVTNHFAYSNLDDVGLDIGKTVSLYKQYWTVDTPPFIMDATRLYNSQGRRQLLLQDCTTIRFTDVIIKIYL
jgi:hypothetical protein